MARASVTVIDVYRRHGAQWARLRGDRLAEGPWLDRFCALSPAGMEVLDIGCGSGLPIARELVRRRFGVTGVDGAPEMLALFRYNLPGTPAVLADMRALALEKTFAGILRGTASSICRLPTSAPCSPASEPMQHQGLR